MVLDTLLLLTFVFSGIFLIFYIQNLTDINYDTSQSAQTNREVKTANNTDVIYTSVYFASSRWEILPSLSPMMWLVCGFMLAVLLQGAAESAHVWWSDLQHGAHLTEEVTWLWLQTCLKIILIILMWHLLLGLLKQISHLYASATNHFHHKWTPLPFQLLHSALMKHFVQTWPV